MQELGKLEDLPQDYRDDLKNLNLVPLWPSPVSYTHLDVYKRQALRVRKVSTPPNGAAP